jgi:preprotein translocase subunit SecF
MFAFRNVPFAYRYAIAAIVALAHALLAVLGLFAILGEVMGAEVNAIFIVGLLTVVGYAVNDTIVIFDRVRENVLVAPNRPFRSVCNLAINETMVRSLITGTTTVIVILAMLLFGGATLRDFLIVMLAGIVAGTYSSIFIAANILVAWEDGELARFVPGFLKRRRRAAESA